MINSAILPIALVGASSDGDLDRAILLCDSISGHWVSSKELFNLEVVARDEDHDQVQSTFKKYENMTITFHKESKFISASSKHKIQGWYKQQLIKLIAPLELFDDYFFTLDSDLLVIKDFDEKTFLTEDAKAIPKLTPCNIHDWWKNTAIHFDIPMTRELGFGVTPNILNSEILKAISEYFEVKYSEPMIETLCKLLANQREPWSEYSIYDLIGRSLIDFNKFYDFEAGKVSTLHANRAIWGNGSLTDINTFVRGLEGFFLIMQSTSHVTLHDRQEILNCSLRDLT